MKIVNKMFIHEEIAQYLAKIEYKEMQIMVKC